MAGRTGDRKLTRSGEMKMALAAASVAKIGYGILSAYSDRPEEENLSMHSRLFGDLEGLGLIPVEAEGAWEGVPEKCWMVPGIGLLDLVTLARRYGQEAVVYCPPGGSAHLLPVSGFPIAPPESWPGISAPAARLRPSQTP